MMSHHLSAHWPEIQLQPLSALWLRYCSALWLAGSPSDLETWLLMETRQFPGPSLGQLQGICSTPFPRTLLAELSSSYLEWQSLDNALS